MLDKTKAKRTVTETKEGKTRRYFHYFLVFECAQCQREFRILNQAKILKRHKGYCRKCIPRHRNKKETNIRQKSYSWLLYWSSRRKIEVSLSFDDFKILCEDGICHYCKQPVTRTKTSYQLDRKDSNKGYVPGNVVTCCTRCNMTFGNRFSYKEKLILAKALQKIPN